MKRSSIIGSLASLLVFGGLSACSGTPTACDPNGPLLDKAQLCPDRYSLGFAQEFNSGTIIGTSPPNTLSIRNGGLQDLTIDSLEPTGASQFAVSYSYDLPDGGTGSTLPVSIPGNKHFFIQVLFTPTQSKLYNGLITVKSNAQNAPPPDAGCGSDWCFPMTGCGVPADAGTAPWCLRSGG